MGFASSANQHVVDVFKGSEDVVGVAGWDGSDIDGVAVVVVEQKYVVVSLAGRDWELASEVCVHFPCFGVPYCGVATIGGITSGFGLWECIGQVVSVGV